jgi:excisionase family DNA binding protein
VPAKPPPRPPSRELLDKRAAAEYLQVGRSYLEALIASGELPAYRLPSHRTQGRAGRCASTAPTWMRSSPRCVRRKQRSSNDEGRGHACPGHRHHHRYGEDNPAV